LIIRKGSYPKSLWKKTLGVIVALALAPWVVKQLLQYITQGVKASIATVAIIIDHYNSANLIMVN
jgi:hypothetical protein